ncbi:homeobox protein abdominal-B isoform X3 [Drosophila bipectinata]
MSIQLAPLHIPAIRAGPGFETDASAAVKRHPAAHWAYNEEFNQTYPHTYGSPYGMEPRDRKHMFPYPPYTDTQFQGWPYTYRPDQTTYMSATEDRHVTAAASARQSVEGTSQSSYEPPTYSSPGGLRGYPSEAYSSSGASGGLSVGAVGPCTPNNALHEWTGQVSVRKKRKPYSKFQTLELEKEFLFNAYVSKQKRWELARNLQLTERQVNLVPEPAHEKQEELTAPGQSAEQQQQLEQQPQPRPGRPAAPQQPPPEPRPEHGPSLHQDAPVTLGQQQRGRHGLCHLLAVSQPGFGSSFRHRHRESRPAASTQPDGRSANAFASASEYPSDQKRTGTGLPLLANQLNVQKNNEKIMDNADLWDSRS